MTGILRCEARPYAWFPNQSLRQDADAIRQPLLGNALTKLGIVTKASVEQHVAARKSGIAGPTDVSKRDLILGLKADLFGHAGLIPSRTIVSPDLWQIELIRHRQAGMVVRDRQRHRHLAVRLLAQLSAILAGNPNRMLALFGQAGVVDNPGFDRPVTLDLRQHHLAYLGQHLLVRPPRPPDKMQH